MKLFYKPGACSLASHITLRESGKDFTLGVWIYRTNARKMAMTTSLSIPKVRFRHCCLMKVRYSPKALLLCNTADLVPDHQLLAPVNTLARYQTIEWLNYIATELHKGFTPLFRPDTPEEFKPSVRAQLERNCTTLTMR